MVRSYFHRLGYVNRFQRIDSLITNVNLTGIVHNFVYVRASTSTYTYWYDHSSHLRVPGTYYRYIHVLAPVLALVRLEP